MPISVQALEWSPTICTKVSEPFTGGGENGGHEQMVLMHLLRELKGPTRLLEFLNIPNITRSLDFLQDYKDKLEVRILFECIICLFMLLK